MKGGWEGWKFCAPGKFSNKIYYYLKKRIPKVASSTKRCLNSSLPCLRKYFALCNVLFHIFPITLQYSYDFKLKGGYIPVDQLLRNYTKQPTFEKNLTVKKYYRASVKYSIFVLTTTYQIMASFILHVQQVNHLPCNCKMRHTCKFILNILK